MAMVRKLLCPSVPPSRISLYPVQSSIIRTLLVTREPHNAGVKGVATSWVFHTASWTEPFPAEPYCPGRSDRQYPSDLHLPHDGSRYPWSPPTPRATLAHISRYRPSRAEAGESQYLHFLGGILGMRVFTKLPKPESIYPGSRACVAGHVFLKRSRATVIRTLLMFPALLDGS